MGSVKKLEILQSVICEYFNILPSQLFTNRRYRELIYPRQIFQYVAATHKMSTLTIIGRMHRKDHATVLHSQKLIARLMSYDKSIRFDVYKVENMFFNHTYVPLVTKIVQTLNEEQLTDLIKYMERYEQSNSHVRSISSTRLKEAARIRA